MPPKAKYSKQQIVDAALDIVRQSGFGSLTARSLGRKLGSSARPIFTVFQSMEDVQQEVIEAAKALYKSYVKRGLAESLPFKGAGMQYIMFAKNEPKLFQLLFMQDYQSKSKLRNVLPTIEESYAEILAAVQNFYNLETAEAELLYGHLWIYTHGIAALCATNMCIFTSDEISKLMSQVFASLLKSIKTGELKW